MTRQAQETRPSQVWLVGSAPKSLPDAEAASAFYLDTLAGVGCQPVGLPGGETGELRHNWRQGFMEALARHPALKLAAPADWSKNHPPAYKVVDRKALTAESLRPFMGYSDEAEREYPLVVAQREAHGYSAEDMPYQIGIASPLAGTLAIGGTPPWRYLEENVQATAQEIAAVQKQTRGDALFQMEVPLETFILHKAPALLRPFLAKRMARMVARTVDMADKSCQLDGYEPPAMALHLCTGDFNETEHKTLVRPKNLKTLVRFANALIAAWPEDRPEPQVLHMPAAFGEYAAPTDRQFYAPLGQLALPQETRLALGYLHEFSSSQDLRSIRAHVRQAFGSRSVIPAAACGDGRRSQAATMRMFESLAASYN